MNRIICSMALAVVVSLAFPPAIAAERAARPAVLPPHEIITVVRSTGLNPVGRPTRRGTNYVLRALDEVGQEMRVVVDGRAGEVVSVTPVAYGPRGRELESGPPSIYESGPPILDTRPPVYRAPPVVIEGDEELPVYRRATPAVPPPVIAPMPPDREVVIAPPEAAPPSILTFPRPPGAVPVSPPTAALPESEGDENVQLPPPPPRFPQRAPPPNVKPQQKSAKSASKPTGAKPGSNKSNSATPANSSAPPAAGTSPPPMQLPN